MSYSALSTFAVVWALYDPPQYGHELTLELLSFSPISVFDQPKFHTLSGNILITILLHTVYLIDYHRDKVNQLIIIVAQITGQFGLVGKSVRK